MYRLQVKYRFQIFTVLPQDFLLTFKSVVAAVAAVAVTPMAVRVLIVMVAAVANLG
jgi:hypothetical protein